MNTSPDHNVRSSKKNVITNVQSEQNSYYERAKRVKFLTMKKLLIMIIEKCKKYSWI